MAKGITQEQVSAAADALVTAGERPTVEKIRAQLGTGSPNTVIRMLETWRGALAERLNQVLSLPDIPTEVGQVFAECWRVALVHAHSTAQAAFDQEQKALLAAQSSLMQERKIYDGAVAAAQELAKSANQDRNVAETRLTDLQRLVEHQASQLAELTQQRDRLQEQTNQLTEELDTHKAGVVAEREAQAAHIRAFEDRAHAEIDRAREETKILKARLRQLDREVVNAATRLENVLGLAKASDHVAVQNEARAQTLEKQLARMDGLPAALLAAQRAMVDATQREIKLQEKLSNMVLKIRRKSPVKREKSS